MAASVVSAISPTLEKAEIERAKRKPTESLTAYDCFMRAKACMYRWTREGSDEALCLFKRARKIDPAFACAYSLAAGCYWLRIASGWISDLEREKAEAAELARRGVRLGKTTQSHWRRPHMPLHMSCTIWTPPRYSSNGR